MRETWAFRHQHMFEQQSCQDQCFKLVFVRTYECPEHLFYDKTIARGLNPTKFVSTLEKAVCIPRAGCSSMLTCCGRFHLPTHGQVSRWWFKRAYPYDAYDAVASRRFCSMIPLRPQRKCTAFAGTPYRETHDYRYTPAKGDESTRRSAAQQERTPIHVCAVCVCVGRAAAATASCWLPTHCVANSNI